MAEIDTALEWRIVQHHPDYEVSNTGIVRRAAPHHLWPKKRPVGHIVSQILSGHFYKRKDGVTSDFRYPSVWLHNQTTGVRTLLQTHTLVCEAFHGERPSPLHQAAHNNGKRLDCNSDNLRWDTAAGNQTDRNSHGTDIRGEKHGGSRLTNAEVSDLVLRISRGENVDILSDYYQVSPSMIRHIKYGRSWRHIPRPKSELLAPIQ